MGEISKFEALLLLNQINSKNNNNVKYKYVYKDVEIAPFHYDYEELKENKKNLSFMKEKDTINRRVSTTGFSSK